MIDTKFDTTKREPSILGRILSNAPEDPTKNREISVAERNMMSQNLKGRSLDVDLASLGELPFHILIDDEPVFIAGWKHSKGDDKITIIISKDGIKLPNPDWNISDLPNQVLKYIVEFSANKRK